MWEHVDQPIVHHSPIHRQLCELCQTRRFSSSYHFILARKSQQNPLSIERCTSIDIEQRKQSKISKLLFQIEYHCIYKMKHSLRLRLRKISFMRSDSFYPVLNEIDEMIVVCPYSLV